MTDQDAKACPSARCEAGNKLLGVIGQEGQVVYFGRPLMIDESFVATASVGRAPEKRFRFTAPCQEVKCQQWNGVRCGVGDDVIAALESDASSSPNYPACGIRDECQWFSQSGTKACSVCAQVVTDNTVE